MLLYWRSSTIYKFPPNGRLFIMNICEWQSMKVCTRALRPSLLMQKCIFRWMHRQRYRTPACFVRIESGGEYGKNWASKQRERVRERKSKKYKHVYQKAEKNKAKRHTHSYAKRWSEDKQNKNRHRIFVTEWTIQLDKTKTYIHISVGMHVPSLPLNVHWPQIIHTYIIAVILKSCAQKKNAHTHTHTPKKRREWVAWTLSNVVVEKKARINDDGSNSNGTRQSPQKPTNWCVHVANGVA